MDDCIYCNAALDGNGPIQMVGSSPMHRACYQRFQIEMDAHDAGINDDYKCPICHQGIQPEEPLNSSMNIIVHRRCLPLADADEGDW